MVLREHYQRKHDVGRAKSAPRRRKSKPRPPWDDTNQDLSKLRLTPAQLEARRSQRVSHNRVVVTEEMRRRYQAGEDEDEDDYAAGMDEEEMRRHVTHALLRAAGERARGAAADPAPAPAPKRTALEVLRDLRADRLHPETRDFEEEERAFLASQTRSARRSASNSRVGSRVASRQRMGTGASLGRSSPGDAPQRSLSKASLPSDTRAPSPTRRIPAIATAAARDDAGHGPRPASPPKASGAPAAESLDLKPGLGQVTRAGVANAARDGTAGARAVGGEEEREGGVGGGGWGAGARVRARPGSPTRLPRVSEGADGAGSASGVGHGEVGAGAGVSVEGVEGRGGSGQRGGVGGVAGARERSGVVGDGSGLEARGRAPEGRPPAPAWDENGFESWDRNEFESFRDHTTAVLTAMQRQLGQLLAAKGAGVTSGVGDRGGAGGTGRATGTDGDAHWSRRVVAGPGGGLEEDRRPALANAGAHPGGARFVRRGVEADAGVSQEGPPITAFTPYERRVQAEGSGHNMESTLRASLAPLASASTPLGTFEEVFGRPARYVPPPRPAWRAGDEGKEEEGTAAAVRQGRSKAHPSSRSHGNVGAEVDEEAGLPSYASMRRATGYRATGPDVGVRITHRAYIGEGGGGGDDDAGQGGAMQGGEGGSGRVLDPAMAEMAPHARLAFRPDDMGVRLSTPPVPSTRFIRKEVGGPTEVALPPYKVDQLRSEVDAMIAEYKNSLKSLSNPMANADVHITTLSRRHVDSISDRPWRQSPGGGVLAPVNVRPVDSMALTAHMDGRG